MVTDKKEDVFLFKIKTSMTADRLKKFIESGEFKGAFLVALEEELLALAEDDTTGEPIGDFIIKADYYG